MQSFSLPFWAGTFAAVWEDTDPMDELFEKSIRTLELPRVLELLAGRASSPAGRERALALQPLTDAEEVRRLQEETSAACTLLGLQGAPPFSGVKDVSAALLRAERGGMLNTRELLDIAGLLRAARRVYGMQEVSWTLRSYEDYKAAKEDGCLCIFENFLPLETCAQKKFTFADLLAQAKTAAVCGIHRVEEPGKSTAAK